MLQAEDLVAEDAEFGGVLKKRAVALKEEGKEEEEEDVPAPAAKKGKKKKLFEVGRNPYLLKKRQNQLHQR